MSGPSTPPIGLQLARTAKAVSRAFDDALAEAGGSLPAWLILLSLKSQKLGNQSELAEAVGIRGATLTHHLAALEADGLVGRRRDPTNRRSQQVELTAAGEAAFDRMRRAATAFDAWLGDGLDPRDLAEAARILERLRQNASAAGA